MGLIFVNHQMADLFFYAYQHHVIRVPDQPAVDPRLKAHVDLSVFIAGNYIVAHKNVYEAIKEQLIAVKGIHWVHAHLFLGKSELSAFYPKDIAFNAVQLKHHFFHKLTETEPEIAGRLECMPVNTKQGYTRCSTFIVDENSVITEDPGLIKLYSTLGYDVLAIQKGYVDLMGFECGFFGGAGGRIGDEIVFNGSLNHHPDKEAIEHFIYQKGLQIKYLHAGNLLDCGSFLYYQTEI